MTERSGLEIDILTIRIPMRLQRRSGRKLIMTAEVSAVPAPKPRRDGTLIKGLVRAQRWQPVSSIQVQRPTLLSPAPGSGDPRAGPGP